MPAKGPGVCQPCCPRPIQLESSFVSTEESKQKLVPIMTILLETLWNHFNSPSLLTFGLLLPERYMGTF